VNTFQLASTIVKLLIVLVSGLMTRDLFKRYRETLNRSAFFLLVFQLLFTVTYLFQFLIPILYDPAINLIERGSYAHQTLSGATFTLLAPFEVLFLSLFAFDVYNPKRTKYLAIIPITITMLYAYAYFRYGDILQQFNGFYEWTSSLQLMLMMEILAVFAFLPGMIFLLYSFKVRSDRRRGLLLSSGFIVIALFVYLLDNLSIQPPGAVLRRIFILAGLIMVNLAMKKRDA